MKEIKFRIVELKTIQVLITKDFDNETDDLLITLTFFLDGIKVDMKLGYEVEAVRDEMFLSIDDEKIKIFVDNARKSFE